MNIGIKITIAGLIMFFVFFIGWILSVKAYASSYEYQVCVNKCYLDLPNIEECIADEKLHWDTSNTTEKQIRNDCKRLIKNEKGDCRINCVVTEIKFLDPAEKFYDTNVKNFPLINE